MCDNFSFQELVRPKQCVQYDQARKDAEAVAFEDRSEAFSLDQLGEVLSVSDLLSIDLSSALDKRHRRSERARTAIVIVVKNEIGKLTWLQLNY